MGLPIITIFTKIDLIDETRRLELVEHFKSIVNTKLKLKKIPLIMESNDDVISYSGSIEDKNLMPLFLV